MNEVLLQNTFIPIEIIAFNYLDFMYFLLSLKSLSNTAISERSDGVCDNL